VITLQAPFDAPTSISYWPNPIHGDAELVANEVNDSISMNGVRRAHIVVQSVRELDYTFRSVGQGKLIEITDFINTFQAEDIRLTDYNGQDWKVQFAEPEQESELLSRANEAGYEYGDLNVRFTGAKV